MEMSFFPTDMALLAAYRRNRKEKESLEEYLNHRVFDGVLGSTVLPDKSDVTGFCEYIEQYKALLNVEKAAIEMI